MNDDPRIPELDDREALAASAMVDGIADADERALVDGSPHLQAWVEDHRRMTAILQDVTVDGARRERSITAALAAFDELFHEQHAGRTGAAAAVPAAPAVTSLDAHRRRRFQPRAILGVAAGIVAVLAIGGFVISQSGRSDDDTAGFESAATTRVGDSSAKIQPAAPDDAGDNANADTASGGAPGGSAPQTIGAIPGPAEIESTDAPPEMDSPAATDAPAATFAPDGTEAPSATESAVNDTMQVFASRETVADPAALVEFVARVDAERALPTQAPTTSIASPLPCVDANNDLLGEVLYGAGDVPALVVRDLQSRAVRALAVDDCRVLVDVTP